MEVHLYVYTVASDVVEQGSQLFQSHPASHDALAASQYLLVQVVPLGRTALWLSHARRPLDGVQLLDLQECVQMVHCPHTVQVVERIVYLLTLFTDEGLHKAAIVVHADHG